MWIRTIAGAGVFAALILTPTDAGAGQRIGDGPGQARITGRVIDAESGAAIAGATVILEPFASGVVSGSTVFLARSWATTTGDGGGYVFAAAGQGRYRLRVSRIGYRPRSVELELLRGDPVTVSLALAVNPIRLEPIDAVAPPAAPYAVGQSREDEIEVGRVAAVRARQAQLLSSDARTLTHADVVEAVTLGETDVLRAIQRLPGVAARDDFAAQPWVRGAPSDHTRIYFDGMPLFNPVHGFGLLSGFGPEVLSAVFFEPGVRSASVGEGAASVVRLASRPAQSTEVRGIGEVSLASARVAVDRRIGSRAGVMVAVRRSYIDALADVVANFANDREIVLPYAYQSAVARTDYQIDDRRAIAVSGLWQQDRVFGDLPDVTVGNHGRWGNALAQATYTGPMFGLPSRHSVGLTSYRSDTRLAPPDPRLGFSAPTVAPELSRVRYVTLGGDVASPPPSTLVPTWQIGWQLTHQEASFDGPRPSRAESPNRQRVAWTAALAMGTVWAQRRWTPRDRLTLEAGARIEWGPSVRDGGILRPAPRFAVRYEAVPGVSLSASVGRHFQYTQSLSPSGIEVAEGMRSGTVWLLAGDSTPPLRSDVLHGGLEWWISPGWLTAFNAYARRTAGLVMLDPLSDPPPFGDETLVTGSGAAHGVELSARRLAGRWTTSLAYGYTRSTVATRGLRFPSPADRRHTLSITSLVRAGGATRFGLTYRYATGFPFTRVGFNDRRVGLPNAQRSPRYSSVDFLFDWQHRYAAWSIGFFLQVRNLLNQENHSAYESTDRGCLEGSANSVLQRPFCDVFQDGLPLFPVIGFRVVF